MSFPRYPEYKDSGVEWLGEVPAHWNVGPIKRRIRSIESGTSVNSSDEPANDGKFGVLKTSCVYTGAFNPDENKIVVGEDIHRVSCPVKAGTLIVSRMNTPDLIGAAGFVTQTREDLFLPDRLWQITFSNAEARFVHYWTLTGLYRGQVQAACTGTSSSMKNLGQDQFGCFTFAAPPAAEQTQIATFLDRETAKIDELVAEQRRLMELLKEKRQAVISHAVTKGLNPDAPMKPSGIEWLGEVPAHWEIGRVKKYFRTCSGGTPSTSQQELYYSDEEKGIPWVRTTDLQNDVLQSVEVFITEKALADTACSILPPGTVMVAMYGGDGTVGKNGLLAISAAINQAVCGLLPSATHSPEFVFRFMQFYRPHWMIGAESSRKDPNISQERVRNAPFPKPPREEQDAIVKFLDFELSKFDTLTAEAQRATDLLQERRTALISAAVTGQIDVRQLTEKQAA